MAFYMPELTEQLPGLKLDALIYDQAMFGMPSVMENLGIPSVEFCNAMAFIANQGIWHPAITAPFQRYSLNPFYLVVNAVLSWAVSSYFFRPILKLINYYRVAHQLKPIRSTVAMMLPGNSNLATLTQLILELDFPTFL